ncbi:MAG: hypothetical protein HY904_03965 [Deltaproteobacteria bacterium]|nr:hypothetical protein [Deltaproteobacteria bacterium]
MGVSSVRSAVNQAISDGRITRKDAEKIAHVAARTSGVSAAEKAEVCKALEADVSFERGARAVLRGVVAPADVNGAAGVAAVVRSQIQAKGLDFFMGLKESNTDSLPAAVVAGFGKFGEILGQNDGDTIAYSARELKMGRETLYVASDFVDQDRMLLGVFDSRGNEVARTQVTRSRDLELSLKWLRADGKAGETITKSPSAAPERYPAGWVARAKQEVERRMGEGDDAGRDVSVKSPPPAVRHQYDFLARTASDSTGVMAFEFEGKKAYLLADYACVSSMNAVDSTGHKLFDWVE